jgi:hypothetical protein
MEDVEHFFTRISTFRSYIFADTKALYTDVYNKEAI